MSLFDDNIQWVQPGESTVSGIYRGKAEFVWFPSPRMGSGAGRADRAVLLHRRLRRQMATGHEGRSHAACGEPRFRPGALSEGYAIGSVGV